MGFVSEFFQLQPVGFLPLNLMVPVVHAAAMTLEFKVLAPFAANTVLSMIDLDHQRVAWAAVVFAFFLHWFSFVLYAECVALQGAYTNNAPRTDNEKTVKKSALAQRLHGVHQNALEFLCYFGLAVTCASVLNGGDAAASKEVATLAIVGSAARVGHLVFYAANQPFFRTIAYLIGLHAAAFIFAGSIFGVWTSPYWAQ